MGIVEDYLNLTNNYKENYGEKTLVLMQVGSFFEVYGLQENDNIIGSNIQEFSNICDMVISRKNQYINKKRVMMAGFGVAYVDKYIKKLQQNNYTIVIYTQDIQAKNTTRSLSEIISPGTYFFEEQDKLSNNICCVWLQKINKSKYTNNEIIIGISCINNITGKSIVTQFNNQYYRDSSTYDDLEREIKIYKPYECIIISNMDKQLINEVVEFASLSDMKIHVVELKNNSQLDKRAIKCEKQNYQKAILNKFFNTISDEIIAEMFKTHEIAMQSFVFLIDFIYEHNPNLVNKLSYPIFENNNEKLLLANHSLKQLNILDDARHSGKLKSVSSYLNNCVTSMGKRAFYNLINSPITDEIKLEESYNTTEIFIENDLWRSARQNLTNIKDIDKFIRKLVFKKVSPKYLVFFYDDIKKIQLIYNNLSKNKKVNQIIIRNNFDKVKDICILLLKLITDNLDIGKSKYINDVTHDKLGVLSPDNACFLNKDKEDNKELKYYLDTGMKSVNLLDIISDKLTEIIQQVEKKQKKDNKYVKIHDTPKQKPSLIATKRRTTLLQNHIDKNKINSVEISKDYNLDLTDLEYLSNGSNKKDLFIKNKQIDVLSNNIQISREKLIDEIIIKYNNIIATILEYQNEIELISKFVEWCDINQNKCYIAETNSYYKPIIDKTQTKSYFNATELRHPLIEHIQTRELYISNDLELGKEKNGVLLYGTNAVGKTSFIKSIGIAIVMAQAGLYVPASKFIYKPYKKIFTRILGNDNLFKGLSTFAVEMSELRTILTQSDENSLVLGDELCSGTESGSAMSIFTSGLEWLYKLNSTFLFATHFHEINNYDELEELTDKIDLMHMEVIYDRNKNELVYDRKLKLGPGDNMYGLEVCKSLNLPDEFLKRAHSIRIKYNESEKNILEKSASHFNKKKIKGLCEICNKHDSSEVHHLKHQKKANKKQFIDNHHKNHLANLINICEQCHNNIHNTNKEHRVVKTTSGYKIKEIDLIN